MKVLNVGADPFPPYQYIDKAGNIRGSDYEIMDSTIKKMGYEGRYIIDDWSKVENMFDNKELEIAFQVQKTPIREKKWHFSKKLRDAVTSIVTSLNGVNYNNLDDLLKKGMKLGVLENYQYGEPIESINTNNLVYFKSLEDLLRAVDNQSIDLGVTDLGVFNYMNKNSVYSNIKVLEDLNFNRPLYAVLNSESLRDEFNYNL